MMSLVKALQREEEEVFEALKEEQMKEALKEEELNELKLKEALTEQLKEVH